MPLPGRPTSIRLFLTDGTPDGIQIVEKSNWNGRALVANRAQLRAAFARPELELPGVYVLTGTSDGGAARLYVGEGDVLHKRLRQHDSKKDFWTRLVAFTSTGDALNKAYIRFIEHRLIDLAGRANQWELDNTTIPAEPPLSEPDRADAENFLLEMLLIYPILGIDAFEAAEASIATDDDALELILDERGVTARAMQTADGIVVLQGSDARGEETPSISPSITQMRSDLVTRGVLTRNNGAAHYTFTQDYRFNSPSTASGVVVGASSNGRRAWRTTDGTMLRDLE